MIWLASLLQYFSLKTAETQWIIAENVEPILDFAKRVQVTQRSSAHKAHVAS